MNNSLFTKITRNEEVQKFDKEQVARGMGKDLLIRVYSDMVRTRALDDKIQEMLQKGYSIIQHATTGQEATPIAACAHLTKQDYVMPYHRGWAWAIGKGMEPDKILAELIYKATGYNKGKGGPHLASYELGILGRPGVQGAHLSIAAGVGLSIKLRKTQQVCVTFFGNGSCNTGNFHEGLNLAATWKAPVIYIVENNLYEIFEKITDTTAVTDLANRALGYGLDGVIADGNDAILMYHVLEEAVSKARKGEGPSLIEAKTYRWLGHGANDKGYYGGYRSKEEVDFWKEKCPIQKMENDLLAMKLSDQEELEQIKAAAHAEIEAAEKFALDSPLPDISEYFADNLA